MLREFEDQMNEMYSLGLSPVSEKLKVSVQKNEAELNLIKAKNGLRVAKMYLNHLIGQDLYLDVEVVNSLDEYSDMIEISNDEFTANDRNELKILTKQLEISELSKKIVQSEYLPQIGVSATYTTYYVKNLLENVKFHPSFAGQISIPILNWGQSKHKRNAAKMKIRQAEIELDNTSELLNLEVQQVKIQVQENYEALLMQKRIE